MISTSNDVLHAINERFNNLYWVSPNGTYLPYVCAICDEFIDPGHVEIVTHDLIKKNEALLTANDVPTELRKCYAFEPDKITNNRKFARLVKSILLSPRAIYIDHRNGDRRTKRGLSCCEPCRNSLSHEQMPTYAIANNYVIGTPPLEISDLTDIELAMLSPVKVSGSFGYCFGFTGGVRNSFKGSLSFFKVDMSRIVRAAAHFDVLGLHNSIVILLYGNMTEAQKAKAREYSRVRPHHILRAIDWLIRNNVEWENAPSVEYFQQRLKNPIVIDNSKDVESENSNIEESESFSVFFPDGTLNPLNGGRGSINEFKEFVHAAQRNNYDIAFRYDLEKELVADFKDNNLVNACILQFPFGRGGMNERRLLSNGSFTRSINVENYVKHISRISQKQMHRELFALILYNMHMKQQMVKRAGMRVRRGANASMFAKNLTVEDVEYALLAKARGERTNTPGNALLDAVDSVAKSVPHSNESTQRARSDAYAHQFQFGIASYFLTVTPDDDNSFLVQVFSGVNIDTDEFQTSRLDDAELKKRAKARSELRVRYPGICALFYEYMLQIVIEEVIGWDIKSHKARDDKPGLFGKPLAFTMATEEQGRKTNHTHIQVWVEEFNNVRAHIYDEDARARRKAESNLTKSVNNVSSTSLFKYNLCPKSNGSFGAFPHDCVDHVDIPDEAPTLVNDQNLRILRHVSGRHEIRNILAYCPKCLTQTWTSEELVESYLKHGVRVPGLTHYPESDTNRLRTMAIEYQKKQTTDRPSLASTEAAINAVYNHHIHTSSCYQNATVTARGNKKRPSNKRKRKLGNGTNQNECRYRHPKKPRARTVIENVTDKPMPWYLWNGEYELRHIKEICPKRHKYDVFHNTYCPAISLSKMTCNTNLVPVMPGPTSQYQYKYTLKPTQEEDTEECKRFTDKMQKTLSKAVEVTNTSEERAEAMRILLAGSFAQQANNVVGPTLGSFLTRNGSRFLFSHETTWCPLEDIPEVFFGNNVNASISFSGGKPFFRCQALNYICRPKELEDANALTFYSEYEVINRTKANEGDLMYFENRMEIKHPSYSHESGSFVQGVRCRNVKHLIKFRQRFCFPDTSEFGGNIMNENFVPNESSERYCMYASILFCPFRTLEDLKLDNSYTAKFRFLVQTGVITKDHVRLLQNMQDTQRNSFRHKLFDDDLQRGTNAFEPADALFDNMGQEDDSDEEDTSENEKGQIDMDAFLEETCNDAANRNRTNNPNEIPSSMFFEKLKDKGTLKCGYEMLAQLSTSAGDQSFVERRHGQMMNDEEPMDDDNISINILKQSEIVSILLSRTQMRKRSFNSTTGKNEKIDVLEANGSAKSIIDWGRKAQLDRRQRRAFEIMTGAFVLSLHNEATGLNHDELGRGSRNITGKFNYNLRKLKILVESNKRRNDQLILLLHGPGGCGKTSVIDMVVEYAREYCSYMENYKFTERTIVVTAMTGVAATHLLGQTVHKALYFYNNGSPKPEQVEAWEDTKLVIVDEISFADHKVIEKIHKILCRLKDNREAKYGGLNIVFAGDFRQLEPVGPGRWPLYKKNCTEFIDFINCFIELNGLHRFKNDLEWGRLLHRLRNGEATRDDIELINTRVVKSALELPSDIRYACYMNRDRDAINTALFENRCAKQVSENGTVTETIVILLSNMHTKNGKDAWVPFMTPSLVWENCGEDDIKFGSTGKSKYKTTERMDPALKLYKGCPVMLPTNEDVSTGKANGTQAIVEKIILKRDVTPTVLNLNGIIPVDTVLAHDVEAIVLRHTNERMRPAIFEIEPKNYSKFVARVPKPSALRTKENEKEDITMKGTQIPLMINNATTGHKLQGAGVSKIFVHDWSKTANWIYVMLSRVKTLKGLFLRKPLPLNLSTYNIDEKLRKMLHTFSKRSPTFWTDNEYNELFDT